MTKEEIHRKKVEKLRYGLTVSLIVLFAIQLDYIDMGNWSGIHILVNTVAIVLLGVGAYLVALGFRKNQSEVTTDKTLSAK